MESIFTTPVLLVLVEFVGIPEYTSENVPDVVGDVVQLPDVFHLGLAPVPDQVVIVPADAVLAVATPTRTNNAARTAVVRKTRVMAAETLVGCGGEGAAQRRMPYNRTTSESIFWCLISPDPILFPTKRHKGRLSGG